QKCVRHGWVSCALGLAVLLSAPGWCGGGESSTDVVASLAFVLHLVQDLGQAVDAADGRLRLGDQRLEQVLVKVPAGRVVQDFLRVVPKQPQIFQRTIQAAAATRGADHDEASGVASAEGPAPGAGPVEGGASA